MVCPKCSSTHVHISKYRDDKVQYQCIDCNITNGSGGFFTIERQYSLPRIAVFDLETAPNLGYFWRPYKTTIRPDHVVRPWHLISWSAKWLNSPEIMHDCLTPDEAKAADHTRIVKSLYRIFDKADILIAHNAEKFDIKIANTSFIRTGLTPPSPYQIIDTLKIARDKFSFTHNNLDALAQEFDIGHKMDTNFDLWLGCMQGDQQSLDYMLKYNDMDVAILEDLYYIFRPWMKSHPNLNILQDTDDCCGYCGDFNIKSKGMYRTIVREYESFSCIKCGGYTRAGGKILRPVAR